jgi:hypothetical protein
MTLRLPGRAVPMTLRRDPRARRVLLRLATDGEGVVVTVPVRASWSVGIDLAQRHANWIVDRLAALPPRVPFADGTVIPLLGEGHVIRSCPERQRGIIREAGVIGVGGPIERLASRLDRWLREEARRQISARVQAKAGLIEREAGAIAIRDMCSRWGSCAADGRLSFSWRLIMAPEAVLDYVVAHEVAHLAVRDHGPGFWKIVAELTADADDARRWLKQCGMVLHRYG